MNRILAAAWTLTLMLVTSPVWAVKMTNLYEVKIPVASQAADARAEAMREGFRDVLMRLTGDPNIDKNKLLRESINKAEYYVSEFNYSAPDVNSSTIMLNIKFNQDDVKRLLKRNGMKQLSNIRPLVLVWLATVNEHHDKDILGGENGSNTLEKFMLQGQRVGLPLIFPVMDMTDMSNITPDNIATLSLPEIRNASKRYQPDAMLIGTIETDEQGFQGKFSLVMSDKSWDWSSTADSADKIFADALDHVQRDLVQGRH